MFINDLYPRATNEGGGLQTEADWKVEPTLVHESQKAAVVELGGLEIVALCICGVGLPNNAF